MGKSLQGKELGEGISQTRDTTYMARFTNRFGKRECFEAGIQPKTVQKYLGHATLQMTMDLYTHVLDTHKQEEMSKLELHMNALENIPEDEQNILLNQKLQKFENNDNLVYFAAAH